jgi:hypothetical protein
MEQRPDRIDWQQSINNPVYTSDGKEIGFVSSFQTVALKMVRYLKEDSKFVSSNYQFE